MYMPPQFRSEDRELALELMRQRPFAALVSNDDEGLPFVTHLPLHVTGRPADAGAAGFLLRGHCARPNPHWRFLQARPRAVVVFQGPHGYQSPRIYEQREMVPSWNYVVLHCVVEARLLEEPADKDALLKCLIGDHEPAYAEQWRSLDDEYVGKMLKGIAAFELDVVDWQFKIKLNQHRPQSHAALYAGYREGNPDERELATWMERLGIAGGAG